MTIEITVSPRGSGSGWRRALLPAVSPRTATTAYVPFAQEFLGQLCDAGLSGNSWPVEHGGQEPGLREEKAL